MQKLEMRIQRNKNLNNVLYSDDAEHMHNGVHHLYKVVANGADDIAPTNLAEAEIVFQKGARTEPTSMQGVLESDLLEIVRHRLQGHQKTEYSTREGSIALTAVEEALVWLAKRSDDRLERGTLGTNSK